MTTHPDHAPAPARRLLAARFNAEWQRLVADPVARRRAGTWPVASVAPAPDGGVDLAALLDSTSSTSGRPLEEADGHLAALVRLAAHDELAARVVLQRVLAPLVLVAVRRTQVRPGLRAELFGDLVATAWVVIRTYPIERRPVKVAANVVRDAEYLTCTREGRLRRASEVPAPASALAGHDRAADELGRPFAGGRHPGDDVTRLFAQARAAGVAEADLDLLDALVLSGRSVGEVARDLRVTPRTVYNRRMAVTARLAEVAAA